MVVDQPYPTPKTNKTKRNIDLSGKVEEVSAPDINIHNLPYSDSEDQEEQEDNIVEQFQVGQEEFPSPTPKEDQGEPVAEASSSKPRSWRINQLLGQVYELEVLEREIKKTNARLTKKNTELHNSLLEMRGMYILLQKRNLRLMKDTSRLYRMVRLSRL